MCVCWGGGRGVLERGGGVNVALTVIQFSFIILESWVS